MRESRYDHISLIMCIKNLRIKNKYNKNNINKNVLSLASMVGKDCGSQECHRKPGEESLTREREGALNMVKFHVILDKSRENAYVRIPWMKELSLTCFKDYAVQERLVPCILLERTGVTCRFLHGKIQGRVLCLRWLLDPSEMTSGRQWKLTV